MTKREPDRNLQKAKTMYDALVAAPPDGTEPLDSLRMAVEACWQHKQYAAVVVLIALGAAISEGSTDVFTDAVDAYIASIRDARDK